MRADQWIAARLVSCPIERRRNEPGRGVAVVAAASPLERSELPGVLVGVAARAAVESGDRRCQSRLVTSGARDSFVTPAQRKARPAMIEAGQQDAPPTLRPVARFAAGTESSLVWIGVAACANRGSPTVLHGVRPPRSARGFRAATAVAAIAPDALVFSGEWKRASRVVESTGRNEPVDAVTLGTGPSAELRLVFVLVAGGAGRAEPEIGALGIRAALSQARRVRNLRLRVAAPATEGPMRSRERKAGEIVIEGPLASLSPPDQLELAPLMLDVATLAAHVIGTSMKTAALANPVAELGMALDAQGRVDAPSGAVAFEAARASVEARVRAAQRAGRDLRHPGIGDPGGEGESEAQPHERSGRAASLQLEGHPYPVSQATATWITMKRYITIANGLCTTCQ